MYTVLGRCRYASIACQELAGPHLLCVYTGAFMIRVTGCETWARLHVRCATADERACDVGSREQR
jgi:hypothetical protein